MNYYLKDILYIIDKNIMVRILVRFKHTKYKYDEYEVLYNGLLKDYKPLYDAMLDFKVKDIGILENSKEIHGIIICIKEED